MSGVSMGAIAAGASFMLTDSDHSARIVRAHLQRRLRAKDLGGVPDPCNASPIRANVLLISHPMSNKHRSYGLMHEAALLRKPVEDCSDGQFPEVSSATTLRLALPFARLYETTGPYVF